MKTTLIQPFLQFYKHTGSKHQVTPAAVQLTKINSYNFSDVTGASLVRCWALYPGQTQKTFAPPQWRTAYIYPKVVNRLVNLSSEFIWWIIWIVLNLTKHLIHRRRSSPNRKFCSSIPNDITLLKQNSSNCVFYKLIYTHTHTHTKTLKCWTVKGSALCILFDQFSNKKNRLINDQNILSFPLISLYKVVVMK